MVFAILGESQQQFGGQCPTGWIEMLEPRPDGEGWIASGGGVWVVALPTKNELINGALLRYNTDIELCSKQMMAAALANGPGEDAKRAKIRAAYEVRKAEFISEVAQIKAT